MQTPNTNQPSQPEPFDRDETAAGATHAECMHPEGMHPEALHASERLPEAEATRLADQAAELPWAGASAALDARMGQMFAGLGVHSDALHANEANNKLVNQPLRFVGGSPRRWWGMAAMWLVALGVGVGVGLNMHGGDAGNGVALPSNTTGSDVVGGTASHAPSNSRPIGGQAVSTGSRWTAQPQAEWVMTQTKPVSPVVVDDEGTPTRAYDAQAVRRSVYVDPETGAELEVIQPDQRVIWLPQPVY